MRRPLASGEQSPARSRSRRACFALRACALVLSAAFSGFAAAQQQAPPPRDIEKRFDTLQAEQRRANRANLGVPTVARPETAGLDTRKVIRLSRITVEGAKAIPPDAIAKTYRPYIGKTVSQADLAAIAGAINDLYREAGYHLSRAIVPPQDIVGGRVRIRVIEGRIAQLVVKGDGAEQFGVRSFLSPVLAEEPARLQTLERQLLLLNDRPGVRILDSTLQEIGTATGMFRLTITVETWRIFATQGFDNLGAPAVGPLEGFLGSNLNSAFVSGDTLGLNLATVPDAVRELQFGRLSYDAPIGRDGARLGGSALYSDEWPGDYRRQFDTHTITETYELKGGFPVVESRKSSFWLGAAADVSEVFGRDTIGVNSYNDHVRTVNLIGDFRLQDGWGGTSYLSLVGRQGLDVFGASSADDTFTSRYGAGPDFSVFGFSYARYQALIGPWSVKVSVAGQLASTALLLPQQFYLGSAAYGPGFYNGDNGVAGLMELRFDQQVGGAFLKSFQLYGFIDRGGVWNVGDSQDVLSLSSAGAGVRFYFPDALQASIAVAVPVHYHTTPDDVHDALVLFSISNALKACPDRARWRCL